MQEIYKFMKSVWVIAVVLLALLVFTPFEATSTKISSTDKDYYSGELRYSGRTFYIPTETRAVLDVLTVYNPVIRQCDSSPLITASNSKIDVCRLKNEQIRWMALSRDLLERWNGKFQYGDTVLVSSGDPSIDGFWIIKDTMNKRFKNYGDLLFDSQVRTLGKWHNVEITRVQAVALVL